MSKETNQIIKCSECGLDALYETFEHPMLKHAYLCKAHADIFTTNFKVFLLPEQDKLSTES